MMYTTEQWEYLTMEYNKRVDCRVEVKRVSRIDR